MCPAAAYTVGEIFDTCLRITTFLVSGMFAEVYLAEDSHSCRRYVVKAAKRHSGHLPVVFGFLVVDCSPLRLLRHAGLTSSSDTYAFVFCFILMQHSPAAYSGRDGFAGARSLRYWRPRVPMRA